MQVFTSPDEKKNKNGGSDIVSNLCKITKEDDDFRFNPTFLAPKAMLILLHQAASLKKRCLYFGHIPFETI